MKYKEEREETGGANITYNSRLISELMITSGSAYVEQIEKELRKSILLFPQFHHFEALRRFSRNLEGILYPKSCAFLTSLQELLNSFLK